MKKLLLILILLSAKIQAQTYQLSGNVNVPAVSVSLYRIAGSVKVGSVMADSNGNFIMPGIQKGNYYLTCTAIGYQSFRSPGFVFSSTLKLKTINLLPEVNKLDNVTITGKKQLIDVLPDKTVLNVQGLLSATGLSAFELLRKAPGVMVDNNNTVILEGKAGVSIFIDGKQSLLSGDDLTNYLKSLQSAEIGTLEIITQPSSKYEAAGSAGVINIRLLKNKSLGTNGSALLGYAIGRYSKYNSSFSVNHRKEQFNFFSTYSNSFNKNWNYINLDRFQNGYEYDSRSTDIIEDRNHNIRGGIDYTLNKQNSFGVLLTGVFRGSDFSDYTRTPIKVNGTTQQVLIANGFTTVDSRNLTANLNYRFQDAKNHELTVDGDLGYFQSDRDQQQPNTYYGADEILPRSSTDYRMVMPVNVHLAALKADYSTILGKSKLAIGIKSSRVKTGNTFDFYSAGLYNRDRSNVFNYTENINAGYISLSQNWKKVSIQAGLRAEQTISDGKLVSIQQSQSTSVRRDYLNLFPSGGITYNLTAKDKVTLSYSRRIDRPDYRSLNPFEYNIDELSFSKGNPFLKPQYTDAVKLSNTYNYTLTTSLTYSYISDFFAQITDTLANNRNFISPQNIANQRVINFGISYPLTIIKWWSVYSNFNLFRSFYESNNAKFLPLSQTTMSLYVSNSFTLPKEYTLEVSGWYSSPTIWSGSYKTRSIGSLDCAAQKTFAHNRFSLRIAVSDILYTSNWSGTSQYGALKINGSGGYDSRQFRLSLKYNLGRKEIKGPNNRASAAEDEQGRIKN